MTLLPCRKFSRLELADLQEAETFELRTLYEILNTSIMRGKFEDVPRASIINFISLAEHHTALAAYLVFNIASTLGTSARFSGDRVDSLNEFFPDTPLGHILHLISRASFFVDDQPNNALDDMTEAINNAQQLGVAHNQVLAIMEQIRGDTHYILRNMSHARNSYSTALKHASQDSFEAGWTSWRLGIINMDEVLLNSASNAFRTIGNLPYWSRAIGARGAVLITAGKYTDALDCFHKIINCYYNETESVTGPAAAVCLSNLTRLKLQLDASVDHEVASRQPEIDPRLYESVLDSTQPRAGPIGAYYWLAELYYLVDQHSTARELMTKAIGFDPVHPEDHNILPILAQDCLRRFFDLDEDTDQIRRCCAILITRWKSADSGSKTFASFSIFSNVDASPSNPARIQKLTSIVDRVICEHKIEDPFWRAEVHLRRAKLAKDVENDENSALAAFEEALRLAEAGENGTVILHASHALGFELYQKSKGLLELAQHHFKNLQGVELLGCQQDQLLGLGPQFTYLVEWFNVPKVT